MSALEIQQMPLQEKLKLLRGTRTPCAKLRSGWRAVKKKFWIGNRSKSNCGRAKNESSHSRVCLQRFGGRTGFLRTARLGFGRIFSRFTFLGHRFTRALRRNSPEGFWISPIAVQTVSL